MKNYSKIKSVKAREILDSRGNPTVEIDLITDLGLFRSSVPSGASKGRYEAIELRDGGRRYQGEGVLKAVRNINNIIGPKIKGKNPLNQKELDNLMIKMDGTGNKSKLGVNAICPLSMAICRAGAAARDIPLYRYILELLSQSDIKKRRFSLGFPKASFNIINGGAHAGNDLDFQEFMIVPQTNRFSLNLQIAAEIYHQLKNVIKKRYSDLATNIGDEGGFAPPIRFPEEALNLIFEAAENIRYDKKIKIILDVASSQFYISGKYKTKIGVFTSKGLFNYYLKLIKNYPFIGIEDPFAQDDWKGWQLFNSRISGSKFLLIGDDLIATNPERIKKAKERYACNAAIIKINQIGTVSETIEAVRTAKSYGWKIVVSHRSGETNDDFIADLAVGLSADFIKTGAPARGERVAKYNRLLEIEEQIKNE